LCLATTVAARSASAETFAALAGLLPRGANAVVVVNAKSLYESPLGQREGWQASYADRFEAAPLILPPSTNRAVMGAELNLGTMQPDWEAAVMELSIDPATTEIAQRRGGRTDRIAGTDIVWLGKLAVLKLASSKFGALHPATRQEAASWAATLRGGRTGELSPYLARSMEYADSVGTQLILAVDVADAFSTEHLKAGIAQTKELEGVPVDEAASILASVVGVKFGALVGEKIEGRLQLDFSTNAAALAPVAKPLLLKIIGSAGAMLPEFANWTAEAGPNSIAIKGELTVDGMRRAFSLLALDAADLQDASADVARSTTVSGDDAKAAMVKASQRYFRGVGEYIKDIDRLQRANSIDQAVMWIENYARKVESLPTRNIDPDLKQYGTYVAQSFRSIVDEASGVAANYDASQEPVVSNYRIGYLPTARTVNYGGDFQRMYAPYGYEDYDVQATQKNMQQAADDVAAAVTKARKTLAQLVTDHETVRKNLGEKYGVEF
jgi:hypothetical protein